MLAYVRTIPKSELTPVDAYHEVGLPGLDQAMDGSGLREGVDSCTAEPRLDRSKYEEEIAMDPIYSIA